MLVLGIAQREDEFAFIMQRGKLVNMSHVGAHKLWSVIVRHKV